MNPAHRAQKQKEKKRTPGCHVTPFSFFFAILDLLAAKPAKNALPD